MISRTVTRTDVTALYAGMAALAADCDRKAAQETRPGTCRAAYAELAHRIRVELRAVEG